MMTRPAGDIPSLYDRYLLPRLIDLACGMGRVRELRAALLPRASGVVLEPGIGSGLNLPLYDRSRVSRVIGVDPSRELLALARPRAAACGIATELIQADAAAWRAPRAGVDTVVLTFTLCTVPDAAAMLANVRAALKPDGRLLICEHGAAPDAGVRRWQDRLDRPWGWFAGGCHLNRDPVALAQDAGFRFESVERRYVPGAPRFAAFVSSGVAVPV